MSESDDRGHDRIEAALAQLGAEHEPPAGWEARVLAATRAPRRRPWWVFAAPVMAVAAGVLIYVAIPGRSGPLALAVTVVPTGTVRGPDSSVARVGDKVHIEVTAGRGSPALWIYRDGARLVMQCPGDPACRVTDAAIAVDFPVTLVGSYTFVAFDRAASLPAPTGSYDADLAALHQAEIEPKERKVTVP